MTDDELRAMIADVITHLEQGRTYPAGQERMRAVGAVYSLLATYDTLQARLRAAEARLAWVSNLGRTIHEGMERESATAMHPPGRPHPRWQFWR